MANPREVVCLDRGFLEIIRRQRLSSVSGSRESDLPTGEDIAQPTLKRNPSLPDRSSKKPARCPGLGKGGGVTHSTRIPKSLGTVTHRTSGRTPSGMAGEGTVQPESEPASWGGLKNVPRRQTRSGSA